MGDLSEIRGLVATGSFVANLIILLMLIPTGFYTSTYEGRTVETPETWDASGLPLYNNTYIHNITGTIYSKDWGKTEFGHDMFFYAYRYQEPYRIFNEHGYKWFGWWTSRHKQEWINENGVNRGTYLYLSELEEDITDGTAKYTVQCTKDDDRHFFMYCLISYNATAYADVKTAWENDNLSAFFSIEWDEMGTTYNAWSIIGMLLWFSLPNVHWIINAIISIPIWIAIIYITFIIALRVLGALFGGGA